MPTITQIELVQRTFAIVAPIADDVAALFYRRLFEIDPSLETMFKGNMADQRRKLMVRPPRRGARSSRATGAVQSRRLPCRCCKARLCTPPSSRKRWLARSAASDVAIQPARRLTKLPATPQSAVHGGGGT
jgi:hypothetical protein